LLGYLSELRKLVVDVGRLTELESERLGGIGMDEIIPLRVQHKYLRTAQRGGSDPGEDRAHIDADAQDSKRVAVRHIHRCRHAEYRDAGRLGFRVSSGEFDWRDIDLPGRQTDRLLEVIPLGPALQFCIRNGARPVRRKLRGCFVGVAQRFR